VITARTLLAAFDRRLPHLRRNKPAGIPHDRLPAWRLL